MTASVTRCSHIYPKTRKAGENKGIQKRHPKQFNALLLREKKHLEKREEILRSTACPCPEVCTITSRAA